MKYAPDIFEFFVEGGDPKQSHTLLHITEPSSNDEIEKGYFFAVVEINNGTTEDIEYLQEMIDTLETLYYKPVHESVDPFEAAVETINRRGHHVLDHDADIHCLVGVCRKGQMVFSYHGHPAVVLFYPHGQELASAPVLDGSEEDGEALFSSLMQGTVNPGDTFFVATPSAAEHFGGDRLVKLLSTRSVADTAKHVEKVLTDTQSDASFAGILFSMPQKRVPPIEEGSRESLKKLAHAEHTTDEILSPPVFGNAGKRMKQLFTEPKETQETPGAHAEETTNYRPRQQREHSILNTILIGFGRALVIGVMGVWNVLRSMAIGCSRFLVNVVTVIINLGGRRRDTIANWKRTIRERKLHFTSLPMMSKALLLGTIICACLFAGSIMYLKVKERTAAAEADYQAVVASIRDRKEAADGSLIYGNEAKAFTLMKEAQDLLMTLPEKTKDQQATKKDLSARIEQTLSTLRKVTTVTSVPVIKLTDQFPSAAANKLVAFDTSLIAYGATDDALYSIDTGTKTIQKIDHGTVHGVHAAAVPKEKDMVAFIYGDSGIATFDKKSGTLATKDITYPATSVSLSDLIVYNQRLYVLDASNGAIYRHGKTQTGYDKGSVWNKEGHETLVGATSMAIDGDLYVVATSSLTKFAGGTVVPFNITGLDPALNNPTDIWTYTDTSYIYILEPAGKRVIVLDKTGKLVSQYTDTAWQNPTGIAVDEAKKTVYILDSGTLLQFSLK